MATAQMTSDQVGGKRPRPARQTQPRAESAGTRTRILDCAEQLFAQHGFHGTSIRDIASLAEVQFALVGYHFGAKLELLDAVVERRLEVLNGERREFLARASAMHGESAIPLRELIEGYVGGFLRRASEGDPGWRNYAQVVAALANSPEWTDLVARRFNDIAQLYLKEFRRTLPNASEEKLLQAFFFAIGVMVAACARPGRIDSLSAGKFSGSDVAALNENLCSFLEGGFSRLAG